MTTFYKCDNSHVVSKMQFFSAYFFQFYPKNDVFKKKTHLKTYHFWTTRFYYIDCDRISLWICGFICQNVFRYACIFKKKNGFCVTFLKYPIHLVFNFVSRTVTYYILSSVYGLAKFVTKTHITHHTSLFICIFYKMNNQFQCDVENTQLN